MTVNPGAYCGRTYRDTSPALGARHLRTRPDTPRTNGKAAARPPDRCVQTGLRARAYRPPAADQPSRPVNNVLVNDI